ncbi:MAG: hypothetical protein KDK36_08035 [Leptospiraceae bacterium]|nr:hypothetical protein [Leptospiraceae bacterium]
MKNIIIGSVVVLAILLGILFFLPSKKEKNKEADLNNLEKQMTPQYPEGILFDETIAGKSFYDDKSSQLYKDDTFMSYEDVIENAERGKINLVWELWKLRGKCPSDYMPSQCNMLILSLIEKNYPPPGGDKLAAIFKGYVEYEKGMQELDLGSKDKTLTFEEKYELVKKKRREIFKDEKDVELVFGLEEAKVNFIQSSNNFLEDNKGKTGDEKVKLYEKLKKETYGRYYDAVKEREDDYQSYQTELFLREEDLNKLSASEKETKIKSLEIKIFGKETAAKIAKGREELAKENEKINQYEAKEKEFLSMNSGISDKEKMEKLKKMRVELLGEEGAELYETRKEVEKLFGDTN